MLTNQQKGEAAEACVRARFKIRGWPTAIPDSAALAYDIAVLVPDLGWQKVQVKYINKAGQASLRSGTRKKYLGGQLDYFAFWNEHINQVWFIPFKDIKNTRSLKVLHKKWNKYKI